VFRNPAQLCAPPSGFSARAGEPGNCASSAHCQSHAVEHEPDHPAPRSVSAHATNEEARKKGEQRTLFADGIKVNGSILMGDGFTSIGEVCLNGCNIGRNLDCSGATLRNPFGYSFSAAGARIAGSAYFSETADWITYPDRKLFSSTGSLRLDGAVIDGELDCFGGEFVATAFIQNKTDSDDQLYAIVADGIRVGSNVLFCQNIETKQKFKAQGAISLVNARVGGDFSCDGAELSFPGEEPLSADGLVVEGTTFLTDITTDGVLRFVQANLKQGCYFNGATFDASKRCKSWTKDRGDAASFELGGASCGIYARDATIGGAFRWKNVNKISGGIAGESRNKFWLFVSGAKASIIEDDPQSWAALDRFEVSDCRYDNIANLGEADIDWRLSELDRQYTTRGFGDQNGVSVRSEFRPQPYIQLAEAFRLMGYQAAAEKVFVHLERKRTWYGDIGILHKFWRFMLDVFLRYGYSPMRPVVFVLFWAAVSAVAFQNGYDHGRIVASKETQMEGAAPYLPQQARTQFNALLYAIDTLVPIVDLTQKRNWSVVAFSSYPSELDQHRTLWQEVCRVWQTIPNQPLGLLLIFNTFFGWLMTTLFAAGVSGLLRTGKAG
jgi:hypothetical protein